MHAHHHHHEATHRRLLWALLLTAGVVALCDWRRLREVDYSLLVTFAGFFVFIGNISHSPAVSYLQQSLIDRKSVV